MPPRSLEGWRRALLEDRTPIVEAALGVLLVVGIGVAVPGHWGLLDLHPHPLWIVVFAIAIRSGAPAGYVAGGLAAISAVVFAWTRPEALSGSFTERDLVEPFLLFLGGAVVSELVAGQVHRLADLERRHGQAVAQWQGIEERHLATLAVNGELEKRIVDQPSSVATLYRVAKRLQGLSVAELHVATVDLAAEFVEAQACALYVYRDGELCLAAGRPDGAPARPAILAPNGLVGEAILQRRVVTIRDRLLQGSRDAVAADQALMAGPLVDANGQLLGVVVVERLDFLKFTPTNVRLFGLVLEWASDALGNARSYERARDQAAEDEASGVGAPAQTMRRLSEEVQRARRHQLPLAIVEITVGTLESTVEPRQPSLLRQLGLILMSGVRAVDIVGRHTDPDTFIVILPSHSIEGARVVAERLRARVHTAGLPPAIRISASSPSLEDVSAERLDPRAERRRRAGSHHAAAPSSAPNHRPSSR